MKIGDISRFIVNGEFLVYFPGLSDYFKLKLLDFRRFNRNLNMVTLTNQISSRRCKDPLEHGKEGLETSYF